MMHGQTKIKSKSSVAVACFLPGRAKDLSATLYKCNRNQILHKVSLRVNVLWAEFGIFKHDSETLVSLI